MTADFCASRFDFKTVVATCVCRLPAWAVMAAITRLISISNTPPQTNYPAMVKKCWRLAIALSSPSLPPRRRRGGGGGGGGGRGGSGGGGGGSGVGSVGGIAESGDHGPAASRGEGKGTAFSEMPLRLTVATV